MWPDSGYEGWFLVEDAVFEHAVDYVAASAREADDSGVVVLALFAFALVVGDGRRVFGGRDEQGLPQRVPEAFVAPSGGSLALDAGAGLAGGRSDADSDPLQADFDYGKDYEAVPRFKYTKVGGYEGGDSLVLSGKLSNDNTIRLYKTDLDVAAGSKIDLTYNKLNSDDSKLQLGLILADDPETVVPVDVTDGSAGNGWKTASVDLSQYAGKKIATLGLIVKAGAD